MTNLVTMPVTALRGVGPKLAVALNQIRIFSVQDLLFHLPTRYENRTRITPISEIQAGNKVFVEGEIISGGLSFGKKRTLNCRIQDGTGEIQLRFFHFNSQQIKQLSTAGANIRCFGEARIGFRGDLEMMHPEYRLEGHFASLPIANTLTPIYATTQNMQQKTWRNLLEQALHLLQKPEMVPDLLPQTLMPEMNLVDALLYVHHPPIDTEINLLLQGHHPAQQRLAFEELISHQLGLTQFRHQFRHQSAVALNRGQELQKKLLQQLPFSLTGAQQRVMLEINNDLAQNYPMLRLVQGDVGSGKTIVAALSLLSVISHQMQGVLMAPTELLAEQHFKTLKNWFTPLSVRIGWLSGSQKEKERREILEKIANHEIDVVIGTHALFQEQVKFSQLALLVIDEQHRFGVHQRMALKEKGVNGSIQPHQLIMTATPIPRTLAMSAYADLDVSIIDELPPGRQPITTLLLANTRRAELIERIRGYCHAGKQVYWVCTLIEDSELLRAEAAHVVWENLKKELPQITIALVHGRMKAEEKEAVMTQFKNGKINLLVATTVIEVGVDVPNATVMIIENAERLGLAQLHQLRGRVGRGEAQSFCVLLYQAPISKTAERRLKVLRDSQDGFYIAEQDLQIRGPGEVLGTKQTGLIRLKVADLLRDQHLLPRVKNISEHIVQHEPHLIQPLLDRWLKGCEQYAEV